MKKLLPVFIFLISVLLLSSCAAESEQETTEANSLSVISSDSSLDGLQIVSVSSFSGVFTEDGEDRDVTDVSAVTVYNSTEKTLQYGEITETFSDGTEYVYKFSTITPGETLEVCEYNASEYREIDSGTSWTGTSIAFFLTEPELHNDIFSFSGTDNILNITNNSSEDISGDIKVYYKNCLNGAAVGGITYCKTISGGILSGETVQVTAGHYSADECIIMYTEIIDTEV
ncbi:MAG: hypothetical protein LUH40_00870 [Clostridiales bacterium]|nr:hypothetical protein [Clostridiales bacterium]